MSNTQDDPSPSLNMSEAEHVDRLCDEFESALPRGEQPRMEDFLMRVHASARAEMLRWLLEIDFLRDRGAVTAIDG